MVFSAFAGFDLGEDFLASFGASFSDFLEFVLERFGGGEVVLSGEAARLREGILRALGRDFSGAFSAGGAGFADAARDDRLGGIAERRKKSQQDVCNCHRPAPPNSQSHVTCALLFRICSDAARLLCPAGILLARLTAQMIEKKSPVLPITGQDVAPVHHQRRVFKFLIHTIVLTFLIGYLAPRISFWHSTLSVKEAYRLTPEHAEHLFL